MYSSPPYAPSSYSWTISGAGVSSDDYTFVNSTTSASEFPVVEFNSFLDYTITVQVDGDCGDSANDTLIFSLNEIPVITTTILEETICTGSFSNEFDLNSSLTNDTTSFTWVVSSVSTFLSGYENSGSGNIPEQTINNSSSSVGVLIYNVQLTSDDCADISLSGTITVNPEPQINNFSETICNESTFSTVSPTDTANGDVVPEGTTYSWITPVSNPVNAITGGSAGTDQQSILGQTLFNETNSPATLTYTVTPTSAEGCVGTPFTVTITVNPTGQVEPVSSQVVCNGDSTTVDFTTDNTGGTTTYTWSNTGGVDINIGPGETVHRFYTDYFYSVTVHQHLQMVE